MFLALSALNACDDKQSLGSDVVPAPALLSNTRLTDQEGRAWEFRAQEGRMVILDFFFTSCPIVCPRATQALAEVQRLLAPLGDRIRFVSVSVDPENDTPEVMRRFALANGADLERWSFVRTDGETTRKLAAELAAFEGPNAEEAEPSAHTTAVYLFDGTGRLRQRYSGSPLDVPRVAREVEQLAASLGTRSGRVGFEPTTREAVTRK